MDDFNPYREWLGLDEKIARPNFYQLFGLDLFEADAEKIAVAADRAQSKVRSFKPGAQAAKWASMLDELAQAKRCLTSSTEKASYDERLRCETAAAASAPTSPAGTVVYAANTAELRTNMYPPGFELPMPSAASVPPALGSVPNAASAPSSPYLPPMLPAPTATSSLNPQAELPTNSSAAPIDAESSSITSTSSAIPTWPPATDFLPPSPSAAPNAGAAPSASAFDPMSPAVPALPAFSFSPTPMSGLAPMMGMPDPMAAMSSPMSPNVGTPFGYPQAMPSGGMGMPVGSPMSPMSPLAAPMMGSPLADPMQAAPIVMAQVGSAPNMPAMMGIPMSGPMSAVPMVTIPSPMSPMTVAPMAAAPMAPLMPTQQMPGAPLLAPMTNFPATPGYVPGSTFAAAIGSPAPAPQEPVVDIQKPSTTSIVLAERAQQRTQLPIILVIAFGLMSLTAFAIFKGVKVKWTETGETEVAEVDDGLVPLEGHKPKVTFPAPPAEPPMSETTPSMPTPMPPVVRPTPPKKEPTKPVTPPTPPKPEPPKPEPPKPEPPKPTPPPTPTPTPEPPKPTPTPMPAVMPKSAEVKALQIALTEVRTALSEFGVADAQKALARVEKLPMLPQHAEKFERAKQLVHYEAEFLKAVREAVKNFKAGGAITIGNSAVAIVETFGTQDLIILRVAGQNKKYQFQDLPIGLAVAIANEWLEKDAGSTHVVKAVYVLSHKKVTDDYRKTAQEWLEKAKAQLPDVVADVNKALLDTYDLEKDLPAT